MSLHTTRHWDDARRGGNCFDGWGGRKVPGWDVCRQRLMGQKEPPGSSNHMQWGGADTQD
eukprot:3016934-Pyramimonas_sp.AAC.1